MIRVHLLLFFIIVVGANRIAFQDLTVPSLTDADKEIVRTKILPEYKEFDTDEKLIAGIKKHSSELGTKAEALLTSTKFKIAKMDTEGGRAFIQWLLPLQRRFDFYVAAGVPVKANDLLKLVLAVDEKFGALSCSVIADMESAMADIPEAVPLSKMYAKAVKRIRDAQNFVGKLASLPNAYFPKLTEAEKITVAKAAAGFDFYEKEHMELKTSSPELYKKITDFTKKQEEGRESLGSEAKAFICGPFHQINKIVNQLEQSVKKGHILRPNDVGVLAENVVKYTALTAETKTQLETQYPTIMPIFKEDYFQKLAVSFLPKSSS